MGRRGFLGALMGAPFALDPERLLWKPGAKLVSIPKSVGVVGGFVSYNFKFVPVNLEGPFPRYKFRSVTYKSKLAKTWDGNWK